MDHSLRQGGIARGVLLVHLVLSPLVFSRDTTEAFESNKVALLVLTALVLAGLGLWSAVTWVPAGYRETWRRFLGGLTHDPLALGCLLFAASAVISAVTSISVWTSLLGANESYAGLNTTLAYVVLFFATRAVCRGPGDAWRLLAATLVPTAVASAYAVLQFARLDPLRWGEVSQFGEHTRPFATFGHANILAAYLVVTLPVVAAFAVRAGATRSYGSLSALAAVAALALAAVLLTLSRGAWLALACAGVFLAVLVGRAGRRRDVAFAGAALLGAVACAAIGLAISGRSDLWRSTVERVQGLTDSTTRREIWSAGLAIFRDHPVAGAGLDTFPIAFTSHRTAAYWRLEWNAIPARAHNEIVQVLATQGALGGIALLVMIAGLVIAGVRAWRASAPAERLLVASAGAGVLAFGVQGLFNFTLVPVGTLFVTLAAVLSAFRKPVGHVCNVTGLSGTLQTCPTGIPDAPSALGRSSPRLAEWAWRVAVIALVGWLMLKGVVEPYLASLACRAGEVAQESGTPALPDFQRAVKLAPYQEFYWGKLSRAALDAARQTESPDESACLLALAEQAAARALRLAPSSATNHANRGAVLAEMAVRKLAPADEALAEFDNALAADPNNACLLADAGQSALKLGQPERARDYLQRGLEIEPELARLHAGLGAVALLARRFEEAAALFARAEKAEWHGDRAACIDARQAAALAYLGNGNLDAAEESAACVVQERRARVEPRLLHARALELLGRPAAALAEYRQALLLAPQNGPAQNGVRRLEAGLARGHEERMVP